MQLRPYQIEARDSVLREWEAGRDKTLLVLPTGTGKTIVFSSISEEIVRRGGRVLILAHRHELLEQARDKMRQATGLACSLEKAESSSLLEWERITVGSVQTLMRPDRLAKFSPDRFAAVIVDEAHHCFPAGTLIGGKPIETIKVGDLVEAYSHQSNRPTLRRVTATMNHPVNTVVKVKLADGSTLCCTPSHPIWDGKAYIDAVRLSCNNMVYKRRVPYEAESVRNLREGVCSQILEQQDGSVLLSRMQKGSERKTTEKGAGKMPAVWEGIRSCGARIASNIKRSHLLLKGMQFRIPAVCKFADHGRDEPQVRISKDEGKQPHGQRLVKAQDDCSIEREAIFASRRKRQNYSPSAVAVRWAVRDRIKWIYARISRMHQRLSRGHYRGSKGVQGGYRTCAIEDGHRGGRQVAQSTKEQGERRHQDADLVAVRVESVEVLKRGSRPEFERLCTGGVVYNLEVEHDNNFFANGILVHNCLAETYQRVLSHFSEAKVLGVTATPDRGDKRNLGQYFESLAYEYLLPQAIKDGYLCKITAATIPLTLDISQVKQQSGDYQLSGLATALDPYLEQIADEIAARRERKIVVFLPLIATSQKFTLLLQQRGVDATEVNGESPDRAEILERFDRQAGGVLCNAMLLTEGWDCPSVDCICVLRPTKIRSLYAQMVGRGTRIHPGKEDLLILDFLWHTSRHELVRPAHLIAESPEVARRMVERLADAEGAAVDLEELQEQAESDVVAEREEALAKRLEELKHRKGNLVDPLQYSMSICAEDLIDYEPSFGWEMAPPSEAQIDALERAGVDPLAVGTAGKASLLLDRLKARRESGLATPKQIRLLERKGFQHVGQWSFESANRMITRIAAANWRIPVGISPRTYQPEDLHVGTVQPHSPAADRSDDRGPDARDTAGQWETDGWPAGERQSHPAGS